MVAEQSTPDAKTVSAEAFLNNARDAIESRLAALVPDTGKPSMAARHSLLLPGKRLRALLTAAVTEHFGGDVEASIDPACAVEMVHTASLIFDDLPAMDDAALRRGAQTPHVLFGEGVAILAGIGLLNGAFGVLAAADAIGEAQRCELSRLLSDAVGWRGLVQGQALDLDSIGNDANQDDVAEIHHGKTGVLFVAAAVSGAIIAGAGPDAMQSMKVLGARLGLAYQAFDDVIDVVASDEAAGKPTHADGNKSTSIAAHKDDVAKAVKDARRHLHAAMASADVTDRQSSPLIALISGIEHHFDRLIDPSVNAA